MNNKEQENTYTIKLEKFEGPMDLLLYLINKSEIDIYDIPISEITEQYLQYLNLMKKVDINVSGEFMAMAATLMYIKSKFLIPTEVDIEEEYFDDPRQELVEQILEYQKFKQAAEKLEEKEENAGKIFFRPKSQLVMDFGDDENWIDVKLFDLINIFSKIMEQINTDDFSYIIPGKITVEMKIEELKNLLIDKKEIEFYSLFSNKPEIWEIVVTFLSILELIKQHFIIVKQHKLFGDIKIFRREVR